MLTAFVLLFIIFAGLGFYVFYTTRYFNDLYGANSILTSKQTITLDKRFSPTRLFSNLLLLAVLFVVLALFHSTLISEYWPKEILTQSVRLFIFITGLVFSLFLIFLFSVKYRLKQINRNDYTFDPSNKSLTINNELTFSKDDIQDFQIINVGRADIYFYRIILHNQRTIVLTRYLSCFDVVHEFFGNVATSFYNYNPLKLIHLIYNKNFLS